MKNALSIALKVICGVAATVAIFYSILFITAWL